MTFWLVQGPNTKTKIVSLICSFSAGQLHAPIHWDACKRVQLNDCHTHTHTRTHTFARSLSFRAACAYQLSFDCPTCVCVRVYALSSLLYCFVCRQACVCMRFVAEPPLGCASPRLSRLGWTDKWWVEWDVGHGMGAWLSRPCQSACLLISRSATHKKIKEKTQVCLPACSALLFFAFLWSSRATEREKEWVSESC